MYLYFVLEDIYQFSRNLLIFQKYFLVLVKFTGVAEGKQEGNIGKSLRFFFNVNEKYIQFIYIQFWKKYINFLEIYSVLTKEAGEEKQKENGKSLRRLFNVWLNSAASAFHIRNDIFQTNKLPFEFLHLQSAGALSFWQLDRRHRFDQNLTDIRWTSQIGGQNKAMLAGGLCRSHWAEIDTAFDRY